MPTSRVISHRSCRSLAELPGKLRAKCTLLQSNYGGTFLPFFRWLFEMAKVDMGMERHRPAAPGCVLIAVHLCPHSHSLVAAAVALSQAIAALNSGNLSGAVRTVPLEVGLQLMEAVLREWTLFTKFKVLDVALVAPMILAIAFFFNVQGF